jgi:predicted acyl esterase
VAAGERYRITVTLTNEIAYDVAAGHRLGLVLSGSNYPRFERNPGTGDDFYEDAAAPVAVENTIALDGSARLVVEALP